jgi:VWFA-related protein
MAQSPVASIPPTASSANTTGTPELFKLDLIALDKDGRPINDLKPEELRLFEGTDERKIQVLSLAAREPLTIGLFFDVSGSRRADMYVNEETRLASEFIHFVWREGDTAFLVGFGPRVIVVTQPTGKPEEIDEGLKQVPGGYWGSTALYDALCSVKPEKLAAIPGRKVYVVFSDFEDNSSRNKPGCVFDVTRQAGVAIFPVVLGGGFTGEHSKKAEKRSREQALEFADETGGEVLIPESHKQLALIFQKLATDLQSAYRISYDPSSAASQKKKQRGKIRIETTREHVTLLYPKR